MNPLLKKAKDIFHEGCVSLMLNTHRTKPDNEADPILLKNLVKEAEERLAGVLGDKRRVSAVMSNLNQVVEKLDHNYNLESLVIFANENFADFTRLAISVENRVVVDNTFATRDLVRALHQESSYYVLVLSRQKARLIEAHNDKVVAEIKGKFPLKSKHYSTDAAKNSTSTQDNLIEEFFNEVDKAVQAATADNALPLVLATETRNFDHYVKVADKKEMILGHINRNREDDGAHHIVVDAWKEVLQTAKSNHQARVQELMDAVNQNKFLSDMNEIWLALQEGKGKTLFVKNGYFQPALLQDNRITPVDSLDNKNDGLVDDIIDEMIEKNMAMGGDVVFVKGDEIAAFENLALVTRW